MPTATVAELLANLYTPEDCLIVADACDEADMPGTAAGLRRAGIPTNYARLFVVGDTVYRLYRMTSAHSELTRIADGRLFFVANPEPWDWVLTEFHVYHLTPEQARRAGLE